MTTREDAYPYPGEQYILSAGAVIFCTFPKVRDGVGYPARVFAVCPAA